MPASSTIAQPATAFAAHIRKISSLPRAKWAGLVEALKVGFAGAYAHLQQKASAHGVNVLQELEVLADIAPFIPSELQFFAQMQKTIRRFYDRHTGLVLGEPWRSMTAFLPFSMDFCWVDGAPRAIVTRVMSNYNADALQRGMEITHWNGTPITTMVGDWSWRNEGANPGARLALTTRSMTVRPLAYLPMPLEDWVTLSTWDGTKSGVITLPWRLYFRPTPPAETVSVSRAEAALARGVDAATAEVNRGLGALFADTAPTREGSEYQLSQDEVKRANPLPDILDYNVVTFGAQSYGYIRIYSFDAPDSADFFQKFTSICEHLPERIILDIRGNPGGTIPSGESVLRLFTTRDVEFCELQFRITPLTKRIVGNSAYFEDWRQSFALGVDTGEGYSQSYPITKNAEAPSLPSWRKKAVLIIDGLSYSTSDFFAAGFQDNKLGPIIGVDACTGAGGANVWSYKQLVEFDSLIGVGGMPSLPNGFDLNLSVRRAMRTGAMRGIPLEGLGVAADIPYQLTPRDVLGKNEDLIAFACLVAARQ